MVGGREIGRIQKWKGEGMLSNSHNCNQPTNRPTPHQPTNRPTLETAPAGDAQRRLQSLHTRYPPPLLSPQESYLSTESPDIVLPLPPAHLLDARGGNRG